MERSAPRRALLACNTARGEWKATGIHVCLGRPTFACTMKYPTRLRALRASSGASLRVAAQSRTEYSGTSACLQMDFQSQWAPGWA
eukprot:15410833-Alexandrium_andersonii.AAC.1